MKTTLLTVVLLVSCSASFAKTGSVMVTAKMRANAMRNIEKYKWARDKRDALIGKVEPWMKLSDEQLWKLLPSQDMPRDSIVNMKGDGCPKCGKEHFKAPYNPSRWHYDVLGKPWKIQCRNCKVWLPGNDFAAYYESSLDKQHRFRLGKGDTQFLKPAGNKFIDDGTGIKVDDKKFFIAAFYSFRVWWAALDAAEDMAILYTLTEDVRYAHKSAVLLDRMADLYPQMHYRPFWDMGMEASTGGSGNGRVQGMIWECWTAEKISRAYDYIYDAMINDKQLVAFSTRMAKQYQGGDKSSMPAIIEHIEKNLLFEFIKSIKNRQIFGNPGMHQISMAVTAIALDRPGVTEKNLDWLFEPNEMKLTGPYYDNPPVGGQIPRILRENLGREGLSEEVGLGYASIPVQSLVIVADLLRQYPGYTKRDIYRDFPKFRNGFTSGSKVRVAEIYSPNWGDANKCGNGVVPFGGRIIKLHNMVSGYRAYGDPAIAREIWHATGGKIDRVRGNIYDADPQAIVDRIKADITGPVAPLQSYNSGGYGLAVLQAPSLDHRRGVGLYYGRMGGHGHHDRLAISLVAHHIAMTPDMGYPQYTGTNPRRVGWTHHIISHNTCMVNDKPLNDKVSWSGKTKLFAQEGPLHVADIDGDARVYEGVSTYRRCVIQVDINAKESYYIDLFLVRGGNTHRLILNGNGPEVITEGLELTHQKKGTLAGPDIAFGKNFDGNMNDWYYKGSGFSYLKSPSFAEPGGSYWVDWKMLDSWDHSKPDNWDAHLRVHQLSQVDQVVLADGIPPEYQGAPAKLRYMHRVRRGENLNSQFVSVLDPYNKTPNVKSAKLLDKIESADLFAAAIEVQLVDGRRDVILFRENEGQWQVGSTKLDGRVVLQRGKASYTVGSTHAGNLASFDGSNPADIRLKLSKPLPQDIDVIGRYIIFDNKQRSDASYRIDKVHDASTLGIASQSLVERYVDPLAYDKGIIHNISPGDSFIIAGSRGGRD